MIINIITMPKQVNSFILPDNIIKKMKDKIKETKKIKKELGFSLCSDKSSNIITKGIECVGTKCAIKVGICPKDQIYLGNYHTHPRSHATMSITDMTTGCDEEIECIGSVPFENIRCFVRKTDKTECFNKISPFEEDEHKIIERGEDLREKLRSPKAIIKTGIPTLIKSIYQYETDVAKYHASRVKLLKENFNRIDVTA